MAEVDRPLFADAKDQIGRLTAELRQMVDLRWQLARLEFEASVRSVKRLATVLAIAALLALIAVPLVVVGTVLSLPEPMRAPVSLIAGLVLLAAAVLAGLWARWRFRRQFVGLEETLEELREDLVWLAEWMGRGEEAVKKGPGTGD
jgi:uncharacterized membrane protein YqjE